MGLGLATGRIKGVVASASASEGSDLDSVGEVGADTIDAP